MRSNLNNINNNDIFSNNLENHINHSYNNIDNDESESFPKINEKIFNLNEIVVLNGSPMEREIIQLIQYILQNYPYEALTYCLKRCFNNSFSDTSQLDKIISYLLKKYGDKGEEIINNILLDLDINSIPENSIQNINEENEKFNTKIVFCEQKNEKISSKILFQNEIFIEIPEQQIKGEILVNYNKIFNRKINNIISLDENENQTSFLGEKHYLFKRFCKRNGVIYIFDFIGFCIKKTKQNKKIKKNEEKGDENNTEAYFICEERNCGGKYKYDFVSNQFISVIPHNDFIDHKIEINDDDPYYYKEIFELLFNNEIITDVQLVRYE